MTGHLNATQEIWGTYLVRKVRVCDELAGQVDPAAVQLRCKATYCSRYGVHTWLGKCE
jgi:hypothetical protein